MQGHSCRIFDVVAQAEPRHGADYVDAAGEERVVAWALGGAEAAGLVAAGEDVRRRGV